MFHTRLETILEAHNQCYPLMLLHHNRGYDNFILVPDVTYTLTGNNWFSEPEKISKRKGKRFYVALPSVSKPHAQIVRNKVSDTVWVKDLKSEQGTFINGRRISTEYAEKVVEGDKITFGTEFYVTLIVKESKFKKVKLEGAPKVEMEVDTEASPDSLSSAVFNNCLLIDRIFSSLPSLKDYRSINKAINTEISKKLARDLKIKLEWGPEQDLTVFNDRLSLMKKYSIFNFEFDVKQGQNQKDINWFIETHGESIKWLKLYICLSRPETFKTAKYLYDRLINCEEIQLSIDAPSSSLYKKLCLTQLPSVKKLTIYDFNVMNSYQDVCKSFPNLEELIIPTDRHKIRRSSCLKNEIFCKGPYEHFFPKLVSLTLGGGFSPEMMTVIVNFPNKLQSLGLIGVDDLQALTEVMAAHAESLTEIKFEIWGDTNQKGSLVIPDMPKLKSLAIKIKNDNPDQGPIVLKTGALPDLRVLQADLGKNSEQNPFPLNFLSPFFPAILDTYSKFKFKKLRAAVIYGLDNSSKSKVNLFRKRHVTDFPRAAFVFDNTELDLYKM